MKEIKLGTFFGNDMILKIRDDDDFNYIKAWEDWVASTKKQAVREYQDDLFLKQLETKAKKRLWFIRK